MNFEQTYKLHIFYDFKLDFSAIGILPISSFLDHS